MRTLAIVMFCALPLAAGSGDSFLLRGAAIHPVAGADIPVGSILVRDGKIAEIGAKVAAPKGVRVIEAKGLHVYPGMIDSGTEMGLTEIGSVRETSDSAEIGDFNPQLRALIAINPASEHIPVTRANGITSVITIPGGGILCGQAALIHLDGWTWREMAVRESAFLHLRFPIVQPPSSRYSESAGARQRPFAELKKEYDRKIQQLNEFFEQARRYQRAKQANGAKTETDLKLEAMLPVLEGKLPLVISADREQAIREALAFAKKNRLRIVLLGASDAWKVASELKANEIPVILGPTLALPNEEDDPYDKPATTPAELHKAGVKFAFGTFRTSFSRNLPYQAATAVAFGLPYAEALKAVTLNPAEIWGVADRIGSIEKGKWADLIVTTGDPLETRTEVKSMFIQGRAIDLGNKHRRLYEKYLNRP